MTQNAMQQHVRKVVDHVRDVEAFVGCVAEIIPLVAEGSDAACKLHLLLSRFGAVRAGAQDLITDLGGVSAPKLGTPDEDDPPDVLTTYHQTSRRFDAKQRASGEHLEVDA
jgi:hypothetical protein